MGRKTVYNDITSEEKLKQCNPENLQIAKEFIEYKDSEGKSNKTLDVYKNAVNIICVFFLDKCGNKSIEKISKRDIIQFLNWLQNDLKVSSSRIAFMRSTLSGVCDYIENIMEVEGFRNVVLKIKAPPKSPVREKTIIEEEKIFEMIDYYKNKEDYITMITLALAIASGLRKSELLEVKMEYLTEESCKDKFYVTSPIKVKGRGKNAKAVKYIIKDIIDPYLEIWKEYRNKNMINDEYLLVNKNGRLNIKQLDYLTTKISKDFNIDFYFHAMRHATCTTLYKKGNDLNKIKVILGHKDVSVTALYNDVDETDELEGLSI
jgi:site-specific recombinase XerD